MASAIVVFLLPLISICLSTTVFMDRPLEDLRNHVGLENTCYIEGGYYPGWSPTCHYHWIKVGDIQNCWVGGSVAHKGAYSLQNSTCWKSGATAVDVIPFYTCNMRCFFARNTTSTTPKPDLINSGEVMKREANPVINTKPLLVIQEILTTASPSRMSPFHQRCSMDVYGSYSCYKKAIIFWQWSQINKNRYSLTTIFNEIVRPSMVMDHGACSESRTLKPVNNSAIVISVMTCTHGSKGHLIVHFVDNLKIPFRVPSTDPCTIRKLTEIVTLDFNPQSMMREIYVVCGNFSMQKTRYTSSGIVNCTNIYQASVWGVCTNETTEEHSCDVMKDSTEGDKIRLRIKVSTPGPVVVHSNTKDYKVQCTGVCFLDVEESSNLYVKCPGGATTSYKTSGDVTKDCPMISYVFTTEIAGSICRMTIRPRYFWTMMVWIFTGLYILSALYFLLTLVYVAFKCCFSCCSSRCSYAAYYCETCCEYIEYKSMSHCHDRCGFGYCPYCAVLYDIEKLPEHAKSCNMKKNRLEEAWKLHKKDNESNSETLCTNGIVTAVTSAIFSKGIYCLIIFILALMTIVPGAEGAKGIRGLNIISFDNSENIDELKDEISACNPNCWWQDGICTCGDTMYGRKLLSMIEPPVLPPKGFFNPLTSISLSENMKSINLDIGSSEEVGDKVVISGESIAIIEIIDHTGIEWEISHSMASEKKKLSIGILDAYQEYEAVFKMFSSDRKIVEGMEMDCTGECSSDCNCKSSTCKLTKFEKDRGWSCNPGWCWAINDGCTCCHTSAVVKVGKVFGYWDLEYVGTKVTLCIRHDNQKYVCTLLSENESFKIESYDISIAKAYGVDKKLPKRVVTVHTFKDHLEDLTHPTTVLLDPELCERQSCKHGEIGDYTFTNIEFLSGDEKKNNDVRMVWPEGGVKRKCNFGNQPQCVFNGIVSSVGGLMNNKINVSSTLTKDFLTKELTVKSHNDKVPELKIRVLPKSGSGNIQLLLKANMVELKRKEIKPALSTAILKDCAGCRGCEHGFHCILGLSIREPDTFTIHLKSKSNSVVVDSGSIIATQEIVYNNISLFTATVVDSITICLIELDHCVSSNVKLSEPELTILPRKESFMTTPVNKPNSGGWFSRLGYSLKKFFFGLYDFGWQICTNWQLILMIIGIIIFLILLSYTSVFKRLKVFLPRCLKKKKRKIPTTIQKPSSKQI